MKKLEFIPTNYPSDLSDAEWELIKRLIPVGNKSNWYKRSLINAVFYLKKTGCRCRFLPKNYPPHDTVWSFFRRARDSGLWQKIKDGMVMATRIKVGRTETPSYAIIDSQSVKTIGASEERGIDGGKKLRDENGISCRHHGEFAFCGDDGYRKSVEEDISLQLGLRVDIVLRTSPTFELLPMRWVVEHTLAWLGNSRRLSRDYEISVKSEEAFVMISRARVLLRRFVRL